MNGLSPTVQWLLGGLILLLVSLIAYVWVDRESRISSLETRVEIREQAWHSGRIVLHGKISDLEHQIDLLKLRCPQGPTHEQR